ncbi:MAG: bglX 15, partial [Bacteroidetes bacterium]|nr:bglX 15 [Bacteroidota bacterium]
VMSSYNDYDGEPVSGSYYFLTQILRNEWGFKGYVVSDSEAVEFLNTKHKVAPTMEDAVASVINAGLNIRTNFSGPHNFILPLRQAISDGKVSLKTIDCRVLDVLKVKFKEKLFDNPYKGNVELLEKTVHTQANQAVSMKAALESMVLLKNDKNIRTG